MVLPPLSWRMGQCGYEPAAFHCSGTQSCPTLCDPMDSVCQASCPSPSPGVCSNSRPIELVMPSNHLILCCPLLLLPSIIPSVRVFSKESALRIRWPKYWSFSFWPLHSYGPPRGIYASARGAGRLNPRVLTRGLRTSASRWPSFTFRVAGENWQPPYQTISEVSGIEIYPEVTDM